MITVEQAVKFVKENNCLKDWSEGAIAIAIAKSIESGVLSYCSKDDKLISLVFGKSFDNKQIHIQCAICKGQLKNYIRLFKKKYPGHFISMFRKGELRLLKFKY